MTKGKKESDAKKRNGSHFDNRSKQNKSSIT